MASVAYRAKVEERYQAIMRTTRPKYFETRRVSRSKCPGSSIKGEVKRKDLPGGRKFSCFAAHVNEQDLFGPAAPCARFLDTLAQRFGFSLSVVFIASSRRSPSVPKTTKPQSESKRENDFSVENRMRVLLTHYLDPEQDNFSQYA